MTAEACTASELGEQFDPFGAHSQDPYSFYARARAEEPVFFSSRFGMWFVTRYDDVVAVLRDPDAFSSVDGLPAPEQHPPEVEQILAPAPRVRFLLDTDPPEHTRQRRAARDAFLPGPVAALEPVIREVADGLIDEMGSAPADLMSQFAYPLPLTVILRVLGVPAEDLDRCRAWSQDLITVLFLADKPIDELCTASRGRVAFHEYCIDLVDKRAREPKDDLLSHMLTAPMRGHQPLSLDEVVVGLEAFIAAGHETTANLIGGRLIPAGAKLFLLYAGCPTCASRTRRTRRGGGPASSCAIWSR